MPESEVRELNHWELHLAVSPSEDGRWASVVIRLDKPSSRVSTYINSAASMDMIFERVEGELKNALRHLVNDIHQMVVKPAKGRK